MFEGLVRFGPRELRPDVYSSLAAEMVRLARLPQETPMHDAKGRELKVGDRVMVPAIVTSLGTTDAYCNIGIETIGGRAPDGQKTSLGSFNTKQVYRANEGDDVTVETAQDNGKTFLK